MEDPGQHVGQPTELWVVEATWVVEQEGDEPSIANVAETVVDAEGISADEAEDRVFESIRLAEVEVEATDDGWRLSLNPKVARRVARRHRFWKTVHTIVGDEAYRAERFPQEALDEAWRRVRQEETA